MDDENESDSTTNRLDDTGSEKSATGSVAAAGSDVDLVDNHAPEAVLADDPVYEVEQVVEKPCEESIPEPVEEDAWGGLSKKVKKKMKKRTVFDEPKPIEEPTPADDFWGTTPR